MITPTTKASDMTARDTWAMFFIDKMMGRADDAGYTDDGAIAEGFRLADIAVTLAALNASEPKPEAQESQPQDVVSRESRQATQAHP